MQVELCSALAIWHHTQICTTAFKQLHADSAQGWCWLAPLLRALQSKNMDQSRNPQALCRLMLHVSGVLVCVAFAGLEPSVYWVCHDLVVSLWQTRYTEGCEACLTA